MTIRSSLLVIVLFGALFAAYGNLYNNSRRQGRHADSLTGQAAFVMYQPRNSLLVSLLPGDSHEPPPILVNWLGIDFFREISNVSTNTSSTAERDAAAILDAVKNLSSLRRLRLSGITCSTLELDCLAELPYLESLDLTKTRLDYGQMPWLATSRLKWFGAAHTRFSDVALADLCKNHELQYLNLERSAVSDKSLFALTELPHLRYVNLRRTPVTKLAVTQLSEAMPNCIIDWEPLVLGSPNSSEVRLARRKRIRLGNQLPPDPRLSRRAVAPMDRAPSSRNGSWPSYYQRMQLDVF